MTQHRTHQTNQTGGIWDSKLGPDKNPDVLCLGRPVEVLIWAALRATGWTQITSQMHAIWLASRLGLSGMYGHSSGRRTIWPHTSCTTCLACLDRSSLSQTQRRLGEPDGAASGRLSLPNQMDLIWAVSPRLILMDDLECKITHACTHALTHVHNRTRPK